MAENAFEAHLRCVGMRTIQKFTINTTVSGIIASAPSGPYSGITRIFDAFWFINSIKTDCNIHTLAINHWFSTNYNKFYHKSDKKDFFNRYECIIVRNLLVIDDSSMMRNCSHRVIILRNHRVEKFNFIIFVIDFIIIWSLSPMWQRLLQSFLSMYWSCNQLHHYHII